MRTHPILAAALCLLCASSCIEFESQTLTFRYDKAADTLRIFQLYEGIYGNDSQDTLNENETKEIASVLDGERTFFFANWIFECNKPQLEKFVADQRDKPDDPKAKPEDVAAKQEILAFVEMVLANVKIENGRYFMNGANKLSGYQLVTVENASKVAEQANRAISAAILASPPDDDVSPLSYRRIIDAAKQGYHWIQIDGNCIRGRLPLEHADAMKARRKVGRDFADALALKEGREQKLAEILVGLKQLLQNDMWASYVDDTVEITVGHPGNAQTEVSLVIDAGKYKPNVVPFAQAHGGIVEVDHAALKDAFLAGK